MASNDSFSAPPNNYRRISICPEAHELFSYHDLDLRENIVCGSYNGVDHYLDIQFRLLRENFLLPLRKNIKKYIRSRNEPKAEDVFEIDKKLNVYRNVRISDDRSGRRKNFRTFEFDSMPFRNYDYEVMIFYFLNSNQMFADRHSHNSSRNKTHRYMVLR